MDLQTRNQYMKAMGIPVWLPKVGIVADESTALNAQAALTTPIKQDLNESDQKLANQAIANSAPSADTLSPISHKLTDNLPVKPAAQKPPVAVISAADAPDCSNMSWSELQNSVTNCELCVLHKSRTQTVFGTGDTQADWMIIGEAPGANEDRQGEPFVGRAGQLLNNMLAAVGLPRNAVYISNVLKCRPPNNRDPKPEESALCRGYLERQIALIQPKLIIVVGRIAAHNLLQVTTPLGRLRGQLHQLPGSDIPVLVTYHPAYLLRQPLEKRKAWQDLQLARQAMHKH